MHDSTYTKYPKLAKPEKQKQTHGSGAMGRRKWGVTANGYEVFIWGDEKVLESDGSDGCTTM